jgi:hypothetical protein
MEKGWPCANDGGPHSNRNVGGSDGCDVREDVTDQNVEQK